MGYLHHWLVASLIAISLGIMAGSAQPREAPTASATSFDFDTFQLLRVNGASVTALTVDQVANALEVYDVIFVGELHDHIANHLAELALLRAIYARAPHIALSMEQFERDQQSTVDDYLAGRIGEGTLTSGLAWKNYDEAYRPLVEFAKDNRLAVIAANAPQKIVRCVGRDGLGYLSKLPAEKRNLIAAAIHAEDGAYKQKFLAFLNGDAAHRGSTGTTERAEESFAAQVTRDDTMAESIANFLQTNPGYKVLHITGTFHAEEGLGTVERLKARAPELKIAVVLPVATGGESVVAASDLKGADFAIRIRKEPEPYITDKERKDADSREAEGFRVAASQGCAV